MNNPIIKEFLIESFENLSSISDELTSYEKNPADKELINSIFRKVHTLKGSAGFLGFQKLQEVTHKAESLLDLLREGQRKLSSEMIDVLLASFDLCSEMLKGIEKTQKEPHLEVSIIVQKLNDLISIKELKAPDELNLTRKDKIKEEMFIERALETQKKSEIKQVEIKQSVAKVSQDMDTDNKTSNTQHNSISDHDDHAGLKNSGTTDSVVRVNVQLLDKIMNVVGELVLNRNQILQYANTLDSSELNRLSQQLNVITSELQADIMTTRMQPVGSVLSKFERIVRDLARSQGKKIKLDLIGKDTELDKTLLEAIRDPLTHLIRNSVDHGVETPEIRKAKGKSEEGKITIRSFHEGGQVSIEIKDDGNGIDTQKVLNKAIQKGIVSQDQSRTMSQKQIQNIIFMPGFSTADQVTNISGRGVGMDVVKSNIEKIGGSVDISSEFGHGTTFKLKIPLTLAIVPALVIKDQSENFCIPQMSLVELVRVDSNSSQKIERLYDSEFFRLRGNLIPIFRLSEVLKLSKNEKTIEEESINIVVLNAEGRIYGLIVDQILDTEEIVVKPLSNELKALTFFAGATIMGDGKVSLILDALGFYNFADKGNGQKIEKINEELDASKLSNDGEMQEILLVELGDHRTYGIPLALVNRLEEFNGKNIEWSGDQAIIKYGKLPMPLIPIEPGLKLKGDSIIEQVHKNQDVLIPCVVVKIRGHLYGIMVSSIKDISIVEGSIFTDSIDREGLLGTIFIQDHSITLLDIHSILKSQPIYKSIAESKHKKIGRVLLVDDSPLVRRLQGDLLLEKGMM